MVEESGSCPLEFRLVHNCPIGSHVGHVDELPFTVAVVALRFLDVLDAVRIVPLGGFFSGLSQHSRAAAGEVEEVDVDVDHIRWKLILSAEEDRHQKSIAGSVT